MPQILYRTLCCGDAPRKQKVLVYEDAEWTHVQRHLTRDARLAAAARVDPDKRQAMKQTSRKMQDTWTNTIDNVRDAQLKARAERLDAQEKARTQRFLEIQQENAAERKKYLEECRKLISYQKDDFKNLNSALVFSETMREREAQVAFDKQHRGLDVVREEAYVAKIRKDVADYEEEERAKVVEKRQNMLKYREVLIRQISEEDEAKMKETSADVATEKEEIVGMLKEIAMGEKMEKEELERKRALVRQNVSESFEAEERKKLERQLEEEEEDKAIAIYKATKQRIDWRRREVEREVREQMQLRQRMISGIVGDAQDARDAAENASIKKALDALEAKEELRVQREADHRRTMREDSTKNYHDFLEQEERRKRSEKHLVEWETMQRLKLDELSNAATANEKKKAEENIAVTKANYDAQIAAEKTVLEKAARVELEAVAALKAKIAAEHEEFLEYADGVLAESKQKGRMLLPMQRVVIQYKVNNGLQQVEKNRKLHQSKVPCCEVRKWGKRSATSCTVKSS